MYGARIIIKSKFGANKRCCCWSWRGRDVAPGVGEPHTHILIRQLKSSAHIQGRESKANKAKHGWLGNTDLHTFYNLKQLFKAALNHTENFLTVTFLGSIKDKYTLWTWNFYRDMGNDSECKARSQTLTSSGVYTWRLCRSGIIQKNMQQKTL